MSAGFDERFTSERLAADRWIPHYLPQWTTPERSAARFRVGAGLELRIDADQPPWREEDGGLRASSIQTARFSGAVGSAVGTHRHAPGMRVRTAEANRRLWTASSGAVEVELSGPRDPACMLAVWLVGVESGGPDDSGELCVVELFGDRLGETGSVVCLGLKAVNDPRLTTDTVERAVPFDARDRHRYAVRWDAGEASFEINGVEVHRTAAPDYALQLMVSLFEFRDGSADVGRYPMTGMVHRVRAEGE